MILTLPYPPSVNSVYRTYMNRVIISKAGREYITKCILTINQQMRSHLVNFPLKGRLRVQYDVYCPDARGRDLANLDKILSDCITKAGLWEDDSNIDDLRFIRRDIDRKDPRIIATIEELT